MHDQTPEPYAPILLRSSLRLKTQRLLTNRPRTLTMKKIREDCGSIFSIDFLINLQTGKNVGNVDYVQTVYEYLSNKQLRV